MKIPARKSRDYFNKFDKSNVDNYNACNNIDLVNVGQLCQHIK